MTPREEKDLLIRVVRKLAITQLIKGGFIPFGATLDSKRHVQLLMPKSMKKNTTRDELQVYWARELKQAAASGACKTVCWCADVRADSDGGALVPAVFVHIEHCDAYAEDIFYPYVNEGSECEVTEHQIFISPAPCVFPPSE